MNNYIENSVKYRMGEWYNKEYYCCEFNWDSEKFIPTDNLRGREWIERWIKYGIDKNPGVIVDSEDHLSELQFENKLGRLRSQFGLEAKNIPYISHNRYYNKNNSILFSLPCTLRLLAKMLKRKDSYSFDEKVNEVVWRGSLTGRDRNGANFFLSENIESYANDIQRIKFAKALSNKNNIKIVPFGEKKYKTMQDKKLKNLSYYDKFKKENEDLFGDSLDWFKEICANKYILNLEGHDWPSSLIPSLASNSVTLAVMPKWHNVANLKLERWVHYVPLKDDVSDFYQKLEWCRNNDLECKNISMRASEYISQFTPSSEEHIEKLIFKNLIKNNKLIHK